MTIKVLIVDDQKTVQEILKGYIEEESSLEFVACANNGQEALDMVKVCRPHIVLMDIEMPVLDGLTATKIISEQFIDTKVLIISVHNEDSYLNTALQVGAKGYLLKNTPSKELINAIYSAYKGYFQLGPGLLEKYLHKVSSSEANAQELQQLKNVILQQSQYLETLRQGGNNQPSSSNDSRSRRSNSRDYLESQYANLEKQVYVLSNRIDKQNKKIAFLQQSGIFIILCGGVLATFVLLFSL
ncbi:response regulator transcription factor [Waterburya agarophytonicola K14]|uniref:Response regulator transcription factor n=1 Tax=Waterburya agarophytonicola KI4 TaxID=2874699 RepID=A0A964FFG4_9CYAN|nr:response regulator transcription factor [Waterburya agarophytonicola]MCC0175799.1 response regulator transcription factor [Waterburya agarophytonicola KI4]